MTTNFSFQRLYAVIVKEFIQMWRDFGTILLMIGIPFMQTILFGYAINSDPKHLPTALVLNDNSPFVRSIMQGIENSGYFELKKQIFSEADAEKLLRAGNVQFVLNIPTDFTRKLVRQEHPSILLEADASDPGAVSNAFAAINVLKQQVLQYDINGQLNYLQNTPPPFNIIFHAQFNPAGITQYNIVPGLLGIVLTMTMVITTSIGITKEKERGTLENLLATPLRPLEIMLGKITPYILLGYIQASLIILIGKFLFHIPLMGNLLLLFILTLPFIAANLAVGMTLSAIATNPLQAVQMAIFFYLPSILLSGFMFPFRGMPHWAQIIGSLLPLTHFIRITRGILLKGAGFMDLWPEVLSIVIFLVIVLLIGVRKFRRTLD